MNIFGNGINLKDMNHTGCIISFCQGWLILFLLQFNVLYAQNPQHYTYDDKNGFPSNEIYSIVQDKQGFIWVGGDAGLYKFNGIRYIPYKSPAQKSKSMTGLTVSSLGTLYCYNFQGQIFYVEQDQNQGSGYALKELKHNFTELTNITADREGNIFVSHTNGLASYDESSGKWTFHKQKSHQSTLEFNRHVTKTSTLVNDKNEIRYISADGIGVIGNNRKFNYPSNYFSNTSPGRFLLGNRKDETWIFSSENNLIYCFSNGKIVPVQNQNLNKMIRNRKLTAVKLLPDGFLWICTYKGIIRYDPDTDSAELFYPELSFSDCLIDRKGNYWFSTLQSGIMRVPNLDILVWDSENELLKNDKLTKITTDGHHIYFSTGNGTIGQVNPDNNQLITYHTGNDADVQSLDYDGVEKILYFNINNYLFALKNGTSTLRQTQGSVVNIEKSYQTDSVSAIKTVYRSGEKLFIGTNRYAFVKKGNQTTLITNGWIREIKYDTVSGYLWLATNQGLKQVAEKKKWEVVRTVFSDKQILSLDFDTKNNRLYVLSFDGKVYQVEINGQPKLIASLSDELQVYKLRFYDNNLYIATNAGVKVFNPGKSEWNTLSSPTFSNVRDLTVLKNVLWLATGQGLLKIPIQKSSEQVASTIFLRAIKIDGKSSFACSDIQIHYGQALTLYPEANIYGGDFQFAYRIQNVEKTWNIIPANMEEIMIQSIPAGAFTIELKAIDHHGNDSGNVILISGIVKPPFWKSWWFYLSLALLFIFVVFLISRSIILNIRKKSAIETELSNLKLTAIQAQMNPHFIFNALNSIQDLVLKGDVENSYSYITTFSDLVRRTLNYSDKDFIDFEQEIKLLNLYLALEQLRFEESLLIEMQTDGIEDIQLPPMLIQPFIENALIHGLLHKEEIKKLSIHFSMESTTLYCVIQDNGIGREQAKAIRKRQRSGHESFSGNAIKKRFEIFNETVKGKFGYRYEDLYENDVPSGTRVTLTIPVKRKF